MNEVLIRFENGFQAQEFMSWFSNSGEQDYFDQKENVDNEDNICNKFEYDYENNIINGSNK